jgi:hypothetical protein
VQEIVAMIQIQTSIKTVIDGRSMIVNCKKSKLPFVAPDLFLGEKHHTMVVLSASNSLVLSVLNWYRIQV